MTPVSAAFTESEVEEAALEWLEGPDQRHEPVPLAHSFEHHLWC